MTKNDFRTNISRILNVDPYRVDVSDPSKLKTVIKEMEVKGKIELKFLMAVLTLLLEDRLTAEEPKVITERIVEPFIPVNLPEETKNEPIATGGTEDSSHKPNAN